LAAAYNNLGNLYSDNKDTYELAQNYLEKSLNLRLEVFPADHVQVAHSYNNLGDLYIHMGEFQKAEPVLEKALEIRKVKLLQKHNDVGQSLVNLGIAYLELGKYKEAEPLLRQGLKHREVNYGQKSVSTAYAAEYLAKLLRVTKRAKEAAVLEKRVAAMRKSAQS
jgi:tetratricopeptide (TPR) repeat protein